MASSAHPDYLAAFRVNHKAKAYMNKIRKLPTPVSRASSYDRLGNQRQLSVEDFSSQNVRLESFANSFIVVENINLPWISALGTTYHIEASFFVDYLSGPSATTDPLWTSVFGTTHVDREALPVTDVTSNSSHEAPWDKAYCWHADGIFSSELPMAQMIGGTERSTPMMRKAETSGSTSQLLTRISCWTCRRGTVTTCNCP
jgi:hypothetical protein